MKHLSSMFAVLALVLAACGGSAGTAATVDGEAITVDDVDALVAQDGAIPNETFVAELQNLIISKVAVDAAREQFGIDPTDEEIEEQYQTFVDQISQAAGGDYEAALEAQGLTDARIRQGALEGLVVEQLQEELAGTTDEITDEDVSAELEAFGDQYTTACVKHILVETEEDAQAAAERLEAGEDFAEVAKDVSIEPAAATSGGDLGCGPLAQWVPEFAEGVRSAEIGVVTDPVESEFGHHLILVESIDDEATAGEAARGQLTARNTQEAFATWVEEALRAAEVEVDPEYGTWVTEPQPSIVPADAGDDATGDTAGSQPGTSQPGTSEPGDSQPADSQPVESQPAPTDEEPAG